VRHHRRDPGDCLICEAPHCSCGGPGLEVVQLPARDAAVEGKPGVFVAPTSASIFAPLRAATVQATLPAGQFTSGTYRGTKTPR